MKAQTWQEEEFEDRDFDPGMHAAYATTSSIIEGEPLLPFWKQGHADIIYAGPAGTATAIEVKVSPAKIYERCIRQWLLLNPSCASIESLTSGRHRITELLNQSVIVLSRSAIYEPYRDVDLNECIASTLVKFFEEPEHPRFEAVHPLTRSVYEQLGAIPTITRDAIQAILKQLATAVPISETTKLPALRLAALEDSSYLVEWTFEDRRLGFSFEQNPKESGWYFVYSNASSERYESGTMDQLEMNRLIRMMLKR